MIKSNISSYMINTDEPDPRLIVDGRRNHRRPHRYGESTSPSPPPLPSPSTRKRGPDHPNPSEGDGNSTELSAPRQPKRVRTDGETLEACDDEPEVQEKQVDTLAGSANQRPTSPEVSILPRPDETGLSGFAKDVEKMVTVLKPKTSLSTNVTADLKHFFEAAPDEGNKKGEMVPRKRCTICRNTFSIDPTTGRRHLAAKHKADYRAWCKANNFESMLPEDTAERRNDEKKKLAQSSLDNHVIDLTHQKQESRVIYTVHNWDRAVIRWMINTDQPIDAFQHPDFIRMIHMAAQAPNGEIFLPGRKATRRAILEWSNEHLVNLKNLFASNRVTGRVSFTNDVWQAGNVDSYFAVTAHYIEEREPCQWTLQMALIGFVRLTGAHTGKRLGQLQYKVVERAGLQKRSGPVTCDNVSSNDGMMVEYSFRIRLAGDTEYEAEQNRVRCSSHSVNLGSQKFMRTYSKAPHYDPLNPDAHIPTDRDEVGIIRAITVKEGSSSARHEKFIDVQHVLNTKTLERNPDAEVERPKHLCLDMPVRWSSTFNMLIRALLLRSAVDRFVVELILDEKDERKADKLRALRLSEDEWRHVILFTRILQLFDNAQQEFSSSAYPSLQLVIPALERLHKKLTDRLSKPEYTPFVPAIQACLEIIEKYYGRTEYTDVYIMAMVLDPTMKMTWIDKEWEPALRSEALELVQNNYKKRHLQMYDTNSPPPTIAASSSTSKKSRKMQSLLEDSDEEEDDVQADNSRMATSASSWELGFNEYMFGVDRLALNQSVVAWWGQASIRLPVWASIARDYLPVMASSVSSEKIFSSSGITISKRRNRLHGDVVEALQILKSAFRHSSISYFNDLPTLQTEEDILDEETKEDELMSSVHQKVKNRLAIDLDDDCYEAE